MPKKKRNKKRPPPPTAAEVEAIQKRLIADVVEMIQKKKT